MQKHGGKAKSLPMLDELSVGALAGAVSKFFTTPISNIVTRKKTAAIVSARSSSTSSESIADIASAIHAEKGILGFWSGYSASLVLTLNPSITFFLYEFFKRCLPRSRREDPGARMTFLMAAVSKAVASTITYPFSLAKTRAQVSGRPPVDADSVEKVKDEVEGLETQADAKKAGRDAKRVAKRSTVFNAIIEIYRTEGAAALYEGVFGEILKGFFSHGVTMIIKEAVHKLIVQTYFLILKALNKYPSPTELASQAGEVIQERAEKAGEMVKEGYGNVAERVGNMVEDGREALGAAGERIGVVGSNATEVAKNAAERGRESIGVAGEKLDVVGMNATEAAKNSVEAGENIIGRAAERLGVIGTNANEVAKNAAESGKEAIGVAGERLGVVGTNASEVAKSANDLASKEAGHLLGNAQEQLGDKIVDVGKGIKPDK